MRIRAQRRLRIRGSAPRRGARRRACRAERRSSPRCRRMCSVSCCPTESIGWSDVNGSWKTIDISRPEICAQPAARHPEQLAPVEAGAPRRRRPLREQAEQREHRDRLAAPALAGDPEDLPRLDLVVDAVDDRDLARRSSAAGRAAPRRRAGSRAPLRPPAAPSAGSNTSRRLSPRKLKARTTVKIARPGKVPIHHHWKYCVPSATIEPHSAVGGCAPSPRNESPDRSRIAFARSSVASTNTGPGDVRQARRGRASLRLDAPSSRADWTYSESPTERTSPRTTRAYDGQATTTIASAAFASPRPSTAATTIARMIAGNAKTRSACA